MKLARDYDHHLNLMCATKRSIPNLMVRQLVWIPLPKYYWIKINWYGSMLGSSNVASCGGIARNHDGNFSAAWSINLGSCTIMAVAVGTFSGACFWAGIWVVKHVCFGVGNTKCKLKVIETPTPDQKKKVIKRGNIMFLGGFYGGVGRAGSGSKWSLNLDP